MNIERDNCDLSRYTAMSPERREEFCQQLNQALEKRLKLTACVWWGFLALAAGVLAAYYLLRAFLWGGNLPVVVRIVMGAGSIFAIGFALLAISIVARKKYHRKRHSKQMGALVWTFVVFMVTVSLVYAPDDIRGLRMILSALTFLMLGSVAFLQARIEQSQLRILEEILAMRVEMMGKSPEAHL